VNEAQSEALNEAPGHLPLKHRLVKHRLVKHRLVEHRLVKHLPVKHGLVKHLPVKHLPVKHWLAKHRLIKHRRVSMAAVAPLERLQPRTRRRDRPVQQALRMEVVFALGRDGVQVACVGVEPVVQPNA
jgi:hypothetical protein